MIASRPFLFVLFFLTFSSPSFAEDEGGFFSKIGDAVSGHIKDAKSRFADGATIGGKVVKSAELREDLPGSDTAHYGTGSVTIEEKEGLYYVQFADNTSIGFAPDLNIYVSTDGDIVDEPGFEKLNPVHLGEMTKPNGSSFYALPAGMKHDEIKSVVVWCRRFSEFMSSAAF